MPQHRWKLIALLTLSLLLALAPATLAYTTADQPSQTSLLSRPAPTVDDGGEASTPKMSHRLIVELQSPSLVEWAASSVSAQGADPALFASGRLNVAAPSAQTYLHGISGQASPSPRSDGAEHPAPRPALGSALRRPAEGNSCSVGPDRAG